MDIFNMIEIIKPGSTIKTKLSNIEGIITGVTIRFNAVQYEISYFDNKGYRIIWMNEAEFETTISERLKIGFVK